jgi:hypothetical protein
VNNQIVANPQSRGKTPAITQTFSHQEPLKLRNNAKTSVVCIAHRLQSAILLHVLDKPVGDVIDAYALTLG